MGVLKDKTIVVGVCGGIAAYKAAELVRLLTAQQARVRVMMSRNAAEFITPLTLQTLSANPVATDTFSLTEESEIGHIRLADTADAIVIAPASADVIAKAAVGIADDIVTTVLLAAQCPVAFAPAMNVHMYAHPTVVENLARLSARGVTVIEPASGDLACGYQGKGRLPDPAAIVEEVERMLSPHDLAAERILVTAGPTQEMIDPVRFVSNRSTGKMGFAIARAAWRRGASVTADCRAVAARHAVRRRADRYRQRGRDAECDCAQFSVVHGTGDGGGGGGFSSGASGAAQDQEKRARDDTRTWRESRTRCRG